VTRTDEQRKRDAVYFGEVNLGAGGDGVMGAALLCHNCGGVIVPGTLHVTSGHRRCTTVQQRCDWCHKRPATHEGECETCWRLPGHAGEHAPSETEAALRNENAKLRAALDDLLDMCDVQARNDGVLSVLRVAMERARKALAAERAG